jgi:uncharacterized protein YfdQ (DUF2303 family)
MADKTAADEFAPGEPVMAPLAVDLGIMARLGTKADGIEIVTIRKPAGMAGVPDEIPVALRRGNSPAVESVAQLFGHYREHPQRKTGQAEAQTFESFCALAIRHKTADSVIFADMDWKKPSLTAIVDHHQDQPGGAADNGKHRVHYAFPLSEEWKKWLEMNSQPMKQQDFAWFLEDRILEVSSPTTEDQQYEQQFGTRIALASQLVELSRGLNVRVDSVVKNAHTLQTGETSISFEETHTDAAGQPLKVPGLFMLYIAPFFMGDKVRIPVRLRYRVLGGKITWFYDIYRPDLFITEFVRATMLEARGRTELPAFEGTPEMPL